MEMDEVPPRRLVVKMRQEGQEDWTEDWKINDGLEELDEAELRVHAKQTVENFNSEEEIRYKDKAKPRELVEVVEIRDPIKAEKNNDKCEYEDCKFAVGGRCMYGLRGTHGCHLDSPVDMDLFAAEQMALSMGRSAAMMDGNFEAADAIEALQGKVFNFVFKGHHYTHEDAARQQGHCPHCDCEAPDGELWREEDDAFIGETMAGGQNRVLCFECPECFEHFFYHYDKLEVE